MCHDCHEAEILNLIGLSRKGWEEIVDSMFERGAVGDNREVGLVVNYLATNFSYQLDINTAIVMEFRRFLSLSEADAEAAVAYRTQHGPFKRVVDLEAVPGINVQKIRDRSEILVAR
jgi:competence ComEA-like helix-hairpin-helix protein